MVKKIICLIIGVSLIVYSLFSYIDWLEPLPNDGYLEFLDGNEIVLSSEQPKIDEALDKYKKAMETNSDINIKKNYELLSIKKSEEEQKKQQEQEQNQKQEENQQNNEQNKSEQNNQEQQNKENSQENNQENKNEDENSQNQDSKDNQNKGNEETKQENENQKNEQNNDSADENKSMTDVQNTEEAKKQEELKSILGRLEGNEKNAFKNNERLQYLQTESTNNNNSRW